MKALLVRRMNARTVPKSNTANNPDRTGEKTHERTMPTTPDGMCSFSMSVSLYHVTQEEPRRTIVIPIMPPTHEWVVDTGISAQLAKNSQKPTTCAGQ